MQLPDENIEYNYQRLLLPPAEAWSPLAELQRQHFLSPDSLDEVKKEVTVVRGKVAAERELGSVPAKDQPLQPGFINLPRDRGHIICSPTQQRLFERRRFLAPKHERNLP